MENSTDAIKIAVIVSIASIVIILAMLVVSRGVSFFNKQTSVMDETIKSVGSIEDEFDNKIVNGQSIILSWQEHGDEYKYYIQTLWMFKEGIAAYEYGGNDPLVTKSMYRDEKSRFYFSKDADYTASLVVENDEVKGFMFVQREE